GEFAKVGEAAGPDTFFTDENLLADSVYVYRVRAVQGGVTSPYSNHFRIHISDPVSFIPAGVRLDPDGKFSHKPLENTPLPWDSIATDDEFPVFGPGDCL